jgi:hypothetical protein
MKVTRERTVAGRWFGSPISTSLLMPKASGDSDSGSVHWNASTNMQHRNEDFSRWSFGLVNILEILISTNIYNINGIVLQKKLFHFFTATRV